MRTHCIELTVGFRYRMIFRINIVDCKSVFIGYIDYINYNIIRGNRSADNLIIIVREMIIGNCG